MDYPSGSVTWTTATNPAANCHVWLVPDLITLGRPEILDQDQVWDLVQVGNFRYIQVADLRLRRRKRGVSILRIESDGKTGGEGSFRL